MTSKKPREIGRRAQCHNISLGLGVLLVNSLKLMPWGCRVQVYQCLGTVTEKYKSHSIRTLTTNFKKDGKTIAQMFWYFKKVT